jgi:hypothetical protein
VGLLGHGGRWVQKVNIAMQNHAVFVLCELSFLN